MTGSSFRWGRPNAGACEPAENVNPFKAVTSRCHFHEDRQGYLSKAPQMVQRSGV